MGTYDEIYEDFVVPSEANVVESSLDNSIFDLIPDDGDDESYAYIKVLGRGAFGEAILYRKTVTNELVVWKEINLKRANDRERNDAINEIEILSQLDHLNIISYYNDFFDGNSLFIEMEYANDGTLHHKIIAQNSHLFPESEVLIYFYQLMLAVTYIHQLGILHRDIKTLNIFLAKGKIVKLGDFGISKVLEEIHGEAETCVGTPYYMSPELVKGESYNEKSDMWACGCVLYELLALQKVFEATNKLRLLVSIMEQPHRDVDTKYSLEIKRILDWTLEKEASLRPTGEELIPLEIFNDEIRAFSNPHSFSSAPLQRISSQRSISSHGSSIYLPVVASISSEVFYWGGGKEIPQKLDVFSEANTAKEVACGFCHFAVVTIEKELFTWANIQGGTEIVGQLGHGNNAMYRSPKKVGFFDGVAIKQAVCGEDFTIILTEEGAVFSCGSNYYGCLGCGSSLGDKSTIPVRINALDNLIITSVSCGDCHVVVLGNNGEVYSWGCGEHGRLGLDNEDDFDSPQRVAIDKKFSSIVKIACGRDNTFILTANGHLLAFGSNEYNKMALNQTINFHSKGATHGEIGSVSIPTPVRHLRSYRVISMALGKSHSVVIDKFGRLLTFGSNKHGQLGTGDYEIRKVPSLVKGQLIGKEVVKCICGDKFTVVATADNQVFSWGNSENGRLGVQLGLGRKNCCLPKPIFGSLHKVVSMASRHWSTIILAELVLSSKVIQTRTLSFPEESLTPSKSKVFEESSESFKFNIDVGESVAQKGVKADEDRDEGDDDSMPPWLLDELENAEFISAFKDEGTENDQIASAFIDNGTENCKVTPGFKNEVAEKRSISFRETFQSVRSLSMNSTCSKCLVTEPSQLEIRVQELELEQLRLLKLVKEQELLIDTLRKERDCYKDFSTKLLDLNKSSSK